jgi:coenzyme PQQ precursor peptide PqqA
MLGSCSGDVGWNPLRPLAAGHELAVPFFRPIIFANAKGRKVMAWTTPVLVEICIGLEINGYMPADGYVPPEL